MKEYPWQKTLNDGETWYFANQRDPRKYPFGCYTCDDVVLSGRGWFGWCESPHELLTFLREIPPRTYELDDDEEAPEYMEKMDAIIAGFGSSPIELTEDLRERISKMLTNYATLEWWGRFETLLSEQSEFAQGVREAYWESTDEEGRDGQSPIPEAQVEAFIEFLGEYGI
jgi:hypothetical protein